MKLISNPFKSKKIKINKIYENKSNGQWIIILPRKKLKKFKKPPKKVEVTGFWRQ